MKRVTRLYRMATYYYVKDLIKGDMCSTVSHKTPIFCSCGKCREFISRTWTEYLPEPDKEMAEKLVNLSMLEYVIKHKAADADMHNDLEVKALLDQYPYWKQKWLDTFPDF